MSANIYIGTSGFYYAGWIGDFYPKDIKKDKLLSYYTNYFKTVEINSSFYHLPLQKTVLGWRQKVPQDFIFSFKLSRYITHVKKLSDTEEPLRIFLDRTKAFAEKTPRHVILIQTPQSLKKDIERLRDFIKMLPSSFLYAFEFRHSSWFEEDLYSLLKSHKCTLVLSDSPYRITGSRLWPYHDIETADFSYIRFHGSKKLFYSSYNDQELDFYAKLIKKKLKKGMNVYAYFNNDAAGFATKNAQDLIRKIKSKK